MTEQKRSTMTVEEAEKYFDRLTEIADKADLEVTGLKFIVGSILVDLHSRKIIDAVSLLERIHRDAPNLEDIRTRHAVEGMSSLFLLEFEQKKIYGRN